jgi:sugar/nucleoside kinase (ribokinase family)
MNISTPIIGAGSPIVDLLVQVDDAFIDGIEGEKGGMELVSATELEAILTQSGVTPETAAGGSAGNTLFALARLGAPASFLGQLGDDADGRLYSDEFAALGGKTDKFIISSAAHTARCLSLITPDSERTMRTDLGAAALLSPDDITPATFAGIGHAHLEGYMLFAGDLLQKVVSCAKEAGCTISLDLASFEVVRACKAVFPELLKNYVDIVFANEDEAAEFCGELPVEEQVAELNKYCQLAVVKLGAEGCCIGEAGKTVRVPAQLAKAIDTTGAGDFWQAGFLFGLANGKSLEECGRYGAILGAEVVQVIGASLTDERWQEIKKEVRG